MKYTTLNDVYYNNEIQYTERCLLGMFKYSCIDFHCFWMFWIKSGWWFRASRCEYGTYKTVKDRFCKLGHEGYYAERSLIMISTHFCCNSYHFQTFCKLNQLQLYSIWFSLTVRASRDAAFIDQIRLFVVKVVHDPSSSLLGPVVPSFRALSGQTP